MEEDPKRGRARWYNNRRKPLEWEADGARYRPTEIVRRILVDAAGIERSPRGPAWWILEDGRDLPAVAGVSERGAFDWTFLHELLAAIPDVAANRRLQLSGRLPKARTSGSRLRTIR